MMAVAEPEAASVLTEQEVWDLVVKNEWVLRREIRCYLPAWRRRRGDLDVMYSDVVLARAHQIMRNWRDGGGASPLTFLVKNCRWYAYEWVLQRKYKKQVATTDIERAFDAHEPAPQHEHSVEHLLEPLPEEYAWVLRCLYVRQNTHREVADHAGFTVAEVKEMERVALFLARFYAGSDGVI